MQINGFDIDGVITIGIYPGPNDIIITGRSYEEHVETFAYLHSRNINNIVIFNNVEFNDKTRETSGQHKAEIIQRLQAAGVFIGNFFEDDPIQAEIIRNTIQNINVIDIVHELTNKENERHI